MPTCRGPHWVRGQSGTWDSKGQHRTTNLKVSGQFAAMCWEAKLLERAFTAMMLAVAAVWV
jgi:hypothetical protein